MKSKVVHAITPDIISSDTLGIMIFLPDEIENEDYTRFIASDLALREAYNEAGGVVVFSMNYDCDPREIYEIPEAVRYAKGMVERCPHLFYYISPHIDVIRPLLLCLISARVESVSDGMANLVIQDIGAARATIRRVRSDAISYANSVGDSRGARRLMDVMDQLGL